MAAVRHLEATPHEQVGGRRAHLRLVPLGPAPAVPQRRAAGTYRRRRLVAALLVVLCSLALLRWVPPLLGDPGAAALDPATIHIVQPGDTYWSIASSLDTDGDITGTVDALSAANRGRALQVGDRLALPG